MSTQVNNTEAVNQESVETMNAKQETYSTISVDTHYDEAVTVLENGKFALPCSVCCS